MKKYKVMYKDYGRWISLVVDDKNNLYKASFESIMDNMIDGEVVEDDKLILSDKSKASGKFNDFPVILLGETYITYSKDKKHIIIDHIEKNYPDIIVKNNKLYKEIDFDSFIETNSNFILSLPSPEYKKPKNIK